MQIVTFCRDSLSLVVHCIACFAGSGRSGSAEHFLNAVIGLNELHARTGSWQSMNLKH